MKVAVISGSPRKKGNTQLIMKYVVKYAETKNVDVKFVNLSEGQVECYRGSDEGYNEATKTAANDLMDADVWLVGTPIYNSFFSSALKNLFEYLDYKKTRGKVAGITIMAAGNIGFIDVQTLITQLLSYFQIITNPQAVFITTESISEEEFSDENAKEKLRNMVDKTLEIASKLQK
ncbi:NAD(P)H-dependent oxidoreductase [Nitrosopumilus sp. K4]|uniref:NADPH-dependent FMN reductase n=1 Tax=Nitrosopumilus sp. K4 TaxID=2795383 RepID=UPI001BA5E0BB|nr:NADPH-dependent FMN reductase [Nitrosopumilus sp. K4]QUC64669.1 NAD(P)H-dependent oxidoreductase [Nitrosopumilus sp. K4]